MLRFLKPIGRGATQVMHASPIGNWTHRHFTMSYVRAFRRAVRQGSRVIHLPYSAGDRRIRKYDAVHFEDSAGKIAVFKWNDKCWTEVWRRE